MKTVVHRKEGKLSRNEKWWLGGEGIEIVKEKVSRYIR